MKSEEYTNIERCKIIGMIVRATSIKYEVLRILLRIHFHWNDTMNLWRKLWKRGNKVQKLFFLFYSSISHYLFMCRLIKVTTNFP